jgi:pilus assembly protein CpaB
VKSRMSSLLMVAAILSLLASVIARHLVTQPVAPPPQEIPPPPPKMNVVVATKEIGYLAEITRDAVKLHAMEEPALPGSYDLYAASIEEVLGRVVLSPIHPGSIVHRGDLLAPEAGGALALVLKENQRAVTIRVDDVKGVAGFLSRGNLVDLISTVPDQNHQSPSVNYLAQGIRVLAIDQNLETSPSEAHVVKAVTLEVTPEQAEAIAKAEMIGSLKLVLRNPHDRQMVAVLAKKTPATQAPKTPLNLLQGRETGPIRTFDCEAQKPCPMTRGE